MKLSGLEMFGLIVILYVGHLLYSFLILIVESKYLLLLSSSVSYPF